MAPYPWQRLRARWSSGAARIRASGDIIVFEHIDDERILELRPAGNGARGAASDDVGWTTFGFRHGAPDDGPHVPDAPYLLVVRVFAVSRDRDEFRRWVDEEHGPRQVMIPGVSWLQAYEEEGPPHSFLNVWGIDDPSVIDGEAWIRVRDSVWWRRVSHVVANADRGIYRAVWASHG
jgi:hypothetical protein